MQRYPGALLIMKTKIIVIVGPTATGKSALAVKLARKFGDEIISADSRQVYRGLNIGTGKITKRQMRGVPHHLLDVAFPRRQFTVSQYKNLAEKLLRSIVVVKNKLPIIVGGSGFYIQALVDNISLPEVKPNPKLRKILEKKSSQKLFKILKKLDPKRAATIEPQNPRRLIRAIEIAKALGRVPPIERLSRHNLATKSLKPLFIGLTLPRQELRKRIEKRFKSWLKKRFLAEVKKLRGGGLSWKRFSEIGLNYKFAALFLQNKINKKEFIEKSITAINQYAKRQMTWFKRDKRIKWFSPNEYQKIESLVRQFLIF